ncbi:MAG: hypothetical protein ACLFO2_01775 [Candidatus Woesearchaeota archaeon]
MKREESNKGFFANFILNVISGLIGGLIVSLVLLEKPELWRRVGALIVLVIILSIIALVIHHKYNSKK